MTGGPDDGREPCANPATEAELRQVTERVYRQILDSGYVVIGTVDAGGMPFAYTVGLTEHGLPELIVTGVPPGDGGRLLLELGNRQRRAGAFTPGQITEALGERWRLDDRPTLLSMGFVEVLYRDNDPHPPTALTVTHMPDGGS